MVYQIHITDKGVVKNANLSFMRTFDIAVVKNNIFLLGEKFLKKPVPSLLCNEPVLIVRCKDRKGTMRFTLFVRTKKVYHGAEFVGHDVTESFNDYYDGAKKLEYDRDTGILNVDSFLKDFDAIREKSESLCIVCLDLNNIEIYRTLYGEKYANAVLNGFLSELPDKVPEIKELYHIDRQSFISPVPYSKNDFDRLKDLLTEFARSNNFNTSSLSALPDIRVGILDLDSKEHPITSTEVVTKAKTLLSISRRTDRNRVMILKAFQSNFPTDFDREGLLEEMIRKKELEIFYQPIFSVETSKPCFFEALLRIVSDKSSEISIFDFVRKIEQSGGIANLGWFILDHTLDFAKQAEKFGLEVSINVSPFQLLQPGFVDVFLKKVDAIGIKRSSVHVEITEGALMYAFSDMQRKLNLLRDSGVGIHIDDFGVAYSSLVYIKRLPASVIKIDKIFIDDIAVESKSEMMVRCIIDMAKGLGLKCVAEGVNNGAQLKVLKDLGCDYVQGFYFSKALSFEKACEFMKAEL